MIRRADQPAFTLSGADMTRINTMPVNLLLDQHLMAEYREFPMVAAALKRSLSAKKMPKIPTNYTLNTGHVCFFYNKQSYLANRYADITVELTRRGFKLNSPFHRIDWGIFFSIEQIEWQPRKQDVFINLERILLRVKKRPNWYRFKGKLVKYSTYKKALAKRGYTL